MRKSIKEHPTLLHRWYHWVDKTGDSPCIFYGEENIRLTYSEFDAHTNRLANSLRHLGLDKESRLGICSSNAWVAIQFMFAAWKLGAVYCPINYQLKNELLTHTLNDLSPQQLVVDRQILPEIEKIQSSLSIAPFMIVHEPESGAHDYDPQSLNVRPSPDFRWLNLSSLLRSEALPLPINISKNDIASIIYTSGTTGKPKGVIQKHAWLQNVCVTSSTWTHSRDVIYCDLPMHHIGGAFSLFARGIWAGASVAVWDRFSTGEFWQRIRVSGASIALLLGVMAHRLVNKVERPDDDANSLAKVHMQPLPKNHREIARRFGFDFVVVGYGSSEAGVAFNGFIDQLTGKQATPNSLWRGYSKESLRSKIVKRYGDHALVSGDADIEHDFIGVPIQAYDAILVDDGGEVIRGSRREGQLVLKPKLPNFLFTGYLNREEESSKALRGGFFYTSDILGRNRHGAYFFKHRMHGLIRVGGENISTDALESLLAMHPQVSQCVIVAVPAREGGEEDIAAFVEPEHGYALTQDDFLLWCRNNIPRYMQPAHIRVIESMPLTATHKVERHRLAQMITVQKDEALGEALNKSDD